MREQTTRELRAKLDEALRGVATLEGMAINFVNRGKVAGNGEYLTRPQFEQQIDKQTHYIRKLLKDVIAALRMGH
jgi:hypothetical protein